MPLEYLRMVLPAAFMVVGALLPGRRASRVAALGIAAALIGAGLFPLWPTAIAWAALWIVLAWIVGGEVARSSARAGGAESAVIALATGLVVLGLLWAAALRQQLPEDETARVMTGLTFIGLGVLQLMLRRNAVRAASAFGALGLGLHVLLDVAHRASPGGGVTEWLAMPAATAVSAALAIRLGRTRRAVAGSAAVSDAHDLHD